jgi:3-oxoacyl-[acyl-carrier-protein] synthase-3
MNQETHMHTVGHSRIVGSGTYIPEDRITTEALLREVDSRNRFGIPHDWIERITGIKEKRVAPADVLPSDMAVSAAREAMDRAQTTVDEIDAIIYTGLTRDFLEPATAHVVQAKLGAVNATVFDVSNACHGFMNGLHLMDTLVATGQVRRGLVVTGEQGSRFARKAIEAARQVHTRDELEPLTAGFTLGDAGAAVILGPKHDPYSGFMGFALRSQGQYAGFCTSGGPLQEGPLITDMPAIVGESSRLVTNMFMDFLYGRLHWQVDELVKYVIHQVSTKVFRLHSKLMGVPLSIMPKTVVTMGNLITANIPLALHNFAVNHEVNEGDKIYLSGVGSGISLSQAGLIWNGH